MMMENQINGTSVSFKNSLDEDFELMDDSSKEDPAIAERRQFRDNEIAKKLGEYLLKGYCMLSDACPECHCILLRTPERQLLCIGCSEVDNDRKKNENGKTIKKSDDSKRSKKHKIQKERPNHASDCSQLENKLKWAVDELTKSHNPNRINDMCTVIINLTETIKVLKEHERTSVHD